MALETVLLAVGSSEGERVDQLATVARDVAGPAGATVVLGHVFTREDLDDLTDLAEYDDVDDPDVVAGQHTAVTEIERRLDEADVDTTVRGAIGEYGEGVVDMAEEVDADMVFVGGRKRSPTGKAVFGSTAQEVLLNSPCPVTFVRTDARGD
jgi:nucleotide-binding universal stress UspA family protein